MARSAVIQLAADSESCVQFSGRTPLFGRLCRFQNPTGPEQLQQIAGRAHQSPLAANILFATQAEAAKTTLFFDLSEDRLDDRLAHFVKRRVQLRSATWWRILSLSDPSGGGGSVIVSTVSPCLSRPVATYRSTSFTDPSVTFDSLK